MIGSYIHPGAQLGVLMEVNCESDFVARTDDFQELVHDLAMQIAAADPQFMRKEDVTEDALAKERDIQRARALAEGKPEKMLDKIVEGRMNKFYEEVCLFEQPFIKENTITVARPDQDQDRQAGRKYLRFALRPLQGGRCGSRRSDASGMLDDRRAGRTRGRSTNASC